MGLTYLIYDNRVRTSTLLTETNIVQGFQWVVIRNCKRFLGPFFFTVSLSDVKTYPFLFMLYPETTRIARGVVTSVRSCRIHGSSVTKSPLVQ